MPFSAPPIMADTKLYSEFIFSWVPNGAAQPDPTLFYGPPGISIARTGVGTFLVTLPAYYTNTLVQRIAVFCNFQRTTNASILPALSATQTAGVPTFTVGTSLQPPATTPTDFTTANVARFFMSFHLKYGSPLTGLGVEE